MPSATSQNQGLGVRDRVGPTQTVWQAVAAAPLLLRFGRPDDNYGPHAARLGCGWPHARTGPRGGSPMPRLSTQYPGARTALRVLVRDYPAERLRGLAKARNRNTDLQGFSIFYLESPKRTISGKLGDGPMMTAVFAPFRCWSKKLRTNTRVIVMARLGWMVPASSTVLGK